MVHIWDVNWLGIKFQFQPLYGMFTNLRYHLGAPVPAPLTSPPTVNGPITVALVGKLSQIVGNLQFMIFPQINPSGTCLGEKFSTFWEQIFKKNEILREKSLHALDALHYFTISRPELAAFYDHCTSFNTAVYGRCISPTLNCSLLLHWVCHKIIWSDFYKGDKMAWQWEVNGAWRVLE